MSLIRTLTCCCCGDYCKGRQWWNRDTGYGICTSCVTNQSKYTSAEDIKSMYGVNGMHYNPDPDADLKLAGLK